MSIASSLLKSDPAKDPHIHFKPKEDITTFELARCMSISLDAPYMTSKDDLDARLASEGDAVSRHWVYA